MSAPRTKNEIKTPALKAQADSFISLGWLACSVMLSNLMAKTGKTQGIKFRSKPPSKAPNMARAQVAKGAGVETELGLFGKPEKFKLLGATGSENSCH